MAQPRPTDFKRFGAFLTLSCLFLVLIMNPCIKRSYIPDHSASSRNLNNTSLYQLSRKSPKTLMMGRSHTEDSYPNFKNTEHRKALLRDLVAKASSIVKVPEQKKNSSPVKVAFSHRKIYLTSSEKNVTLVFDSTSFQRKHNDTATKSTLPKFRIDNKNLRGCNITFNLGVCSCNRTIKARMWRSCPKESSTPQDILEDVTNAFGKSTCGDWATLRGPMQRVVSYTVHGHYPNDYYHGLEELIPRVATAYPGWNMRVYHHLDPKNETIKNWVCSLACNYSHLDFCDTEALPILGNISYAAGRVWRFSVMGDPLVTRYIVRDSDSPILQREIDAVNEWQAAGTCFHMMRDNIFHRSPIMAGMWGGCNDWKPQEVIRIRDYMLNNVTDGMQDQAVLKVRSMVMWN
ncbi:hypothetical protein SK128_027671 [Halocaridina rubra]|uniref:Uncharacterized protein n=1 Tax=Halocaridina rubra TaxID=373956 RepID=A0AAN8ZTF3_HALRR